MAFGILSFLPFNALLVLAFGYLIYRLAFGSDRVRQNIQKEYQNILLTKLAAFLGEKWTFSKLNYLPQKELNGCYLFGDSIDKYDGDWLFRGDYNGRQLSISPIYAEKEDPYSGEKKRYLDVFKGYAFVIKTQGEFSGQTMLLPKSFSEDSQRNYSEALKKLDIPGALSKKYSGLTSDSLEGQAILSQSLLEKVEIASKQIGKEILLEMNGDKIFIAFPESKKLMRVSVATTVMNFETANGFYQMLNSILSILDEIK